MLNDSGFMKFLDTLVYAWDKYSNREKQYVKTLSDRRPRPSSILEKRKKITATVDELLSLFKKAASLKIDPEIMTSSLISTTYLKKSDMMKEIMQVGGLLNLLISENELKNNMQKRIDEGKQKMTCTRKQDELHAVLCFNSHLLWEDAFNDIILSVNSNAVSSPMLWDELMEIASILSSNVVTTVCELGISGDPSCICQILRYLPAMYVSNSCGGTFINLNEFVYMPGALELLLSPPVEDTQTNSTDHPFDVEIVDFGKDTREKVQNRGQPSLVSLFPGIVDTVTEFVKQHGYAAQHRRRDGTVYSSGVTIPQIKEHLLCQIPGLREYGISNSTVKRLFNPPHKGRIAGSRYKGYVDARVGLKSNAYREYHMDAHYLFARNKQRREFAALFKDDVNLISLDDMAKVKVGAAAVSRYHQIRSIYPTNNMPNLPDHDFPVKGYFLNISGYMMLDNLKPSEDEVTAEAGSFENQSQYDSVEVAGEEVTDGKCSAYMKALNPEVGASWQSLFETLVEQSIQHLNVKTTVEELKEILVDTDSDVQDIGTKCILKVFSKLFRSKVVVLDLDNDTVQELTCEKVTISSPSVFVVFKDELTASPTFRKERSRKLIRDYNVENLQHDSVGRLHIQTPYSGESFIAIRAQRFNSTTSLTHITDLYNFIQSDPQYSNKPGLMLMSDSGPDFNPQSLLNEIYFFRLFKILLLDFLSIFTFAARYSAFNCVEHLWAPLSNKLSGVAFSPIFPGDKKPPAQKEMPEKERTRKEKFVFDTAMQELKGHWKETSFDGSPIDISIIKCGEDDLLFNDYDIVKQFLKTPLRDLHKYPKLSQEYSSMFKHIDRHQNEIVFMKCSDRSCCAEFHSPQLKAFFRQSNMRFSAPNLSSSKNGHYSTFLEDYENDKKKYGDNGQPSAKEKAKELGSCVHCPTFNFFSKTEKQRHMSLFHRRQKNQSATNIAKQAKIYKCDFPNCLEEFGSSSALSRHKIKSEHRARDKKKLCVRTSYKAKTNTRNKRRRMTVAEFQRQANGFSSSEEDTDAESGKINDEMVSDQVNDIVASEEETAIVASEEETDIVAREEETDIVANEGVLLGIGDYVRVVRGRFKGYYATIIEEEEDEVKLQYFKEKRGKPYGTYWVVSESENEKEWRPRAELEETYAEIDWRGRFSFFAF